MGSDIGFVLAVGLPFASFFIMFAVMSAASSRADAAIQRAHADIYIARAGVEKARIEARARADERARGTEHAEGGGGGRDAS